MINSLAMVAIASLGMIMPFSSTTTNKASTGINITVTLDEPHIVYGTSKTSFGVSISADSVVSVNMYARAYYGDSYTHSNLKSAIGSGVGGSKTTFTLRTSPVTYYFYDFDFNNFCLTSRNCVVEILFCEPYTSVSNQILSVETLKFGGLTPPTYDISENKIYEVSGGSLSFETEKYDFRNTNFSVSEDGSYLDHDIEFSYDTWYTSGLVPDNIYLEVVDHNNVFEYMSKDANDSFRVPYTLTSGKFDEDVVISPDVSGMYVNPYNLQMSDTYRSGFVDSGDKFYFPAYKTLSEIQSCEFTLVVENCLGNDAVLNINLDYNCSRQHFGSCSTSDYCVTGGRK